MVGEWLGLARVDARNLAKHFGKVRPEGCAWQGLALLCHGANTRWREVVDKVGRAVLVYAVLEWHEGGPLLPAPNRFSLACPYPACNRQVALEAPAVVKERTHSLHG